MNALERLLDDEQRALRFRVDACVFLSGSLCGAGRNPPMEWRMTTPRERTLALLRAHELLQSLTQPRRTLGVPGAVWRPRERWVWRHRALQEEEVPPLDEWSFALDAQPDSWMALVSSWPERGVNV